MGYKLIKTDKVASRITNTIGVTKRGLSLNRAVRERMGVVPGSKLAFFIGDDGNVAISVLDKDSPTGRKVVKLGTTTTYGVFSSEFARHTTPGRYRITGSDGAFWLTDIRWEEEQQ